MSPGPVSDSYDPEFGTGENARAIREAVERQRDRISKKIGNEMLADITQVVTGWKKRKLRPLSLTEAEARVIRFALNRALESL